MLITIVSKGRAAGEAGRCLFGLESRLTGLGAHRRVLTDRHEVMLEGRRSEDGDDAVDFAALDLDALGDKEVREASSAVLAISEGGAAAVSKLDGMLREAAASAGCPVLLLGPAAHHASTGYVRLGLRMPALSPGPAFVRTLYVAILREVASTASEEGSGAVASTIARRMAWLADHRFRTPDANWGRRRVALRPPGGASRCPVDVKSFARGVR